MVNFLQRFFGAERSRDTVDSRPVQRELRKEHPDVVRAREANFERVLEGYLGRMATGSERDAVRRQLIDPETENIVAISAEEMLPRIQRAVLLQRIRRAPGADNVINGKEFTPRGSRQKNFETGLARGFGKDFSPKDLADAEAYMANDPKGSAEFATMLGEEATRYGETVAREILTARLRENDGEDAYDVAAK